MIVKYGNDTDVVLSRNVDRTKKLTERLVLFSDVLLGDYSVFYPSLDLFLYIFSSFR